MLRSEEKERKHYFLTATKARTAMSTHRYQLDGSNREQKKKIDCPYCGGRKTFTRYKDYETGDYLDNNTGLCDRADKCQAHVKPKDFFANNPEKKPVFTPAYFEFEEKSLVHIPAPFLLHTLKNYERNSFVLALLKHFPKTKVEQAIADYFIGTVAGGFKEETSNILSTVFWFVNIRNEIRAGQVKLFNDACKTVALQIGDNSLKAYWMHRVIKRGFTKAGKTLPEWYNDYNEGPKVTCLYGEHLLAKYPNKPVAVTESPKNAIICSMVYDGFVWVATTSLSYLTKDRCKVLAGRKVHLFPDTGIPSQKTGKTCRDLWAERISEFSDLANFTLESVLDDVATEEQKANGYDLADWILDQKKGFEVVINAEDIVGLLTEVKTGKDFGYMRFATAILRDGSRFDLLFNQEGNVITQHPQLQSLSQFFNKSFNPGKLDGIPCLLSPIQQ
jgi:hypothetical protein